MEFIRGRLTRGRGRSGRGDNQSQGTENRSDNSGFDGQHNVASNYDENIAVEHDGAQTNRSFVNEPDTNTQVDRRKVLYVERSGDKKLRTFVPNVTRDVMRSVMTRMPNFAPRWNMYDAEMKEALFREFLGKYRFELPEDAAVARSVWDNLCQDRYPDNIANLRIKALKAQGTASIEELRGNPPVGIRVGLWDQYVDYWLGEEFRRRSELGKKNRQACPEASIHTGGSRSFGDTKRAMEKELQHEVPFRDVLKKTHTNKSGQFVNNLWQEFDTSLEAAMVSKYGEDESNHPMVDPDIWREVAGNNRKGRVRGLGKSLSVASAGSCSSAGQAGNFTAGGGSVNQGMPNDMMERIDQRIDQRFGDLTQSLQQSIQQSIQNTMQQNFQMMMQQMMMQQMMQQNNNNNNNVPARGGASTSRSQQDNVRGLDDIDDDDEN